MANVVKGMDTAMASMNLEKVPLIIAFNNRQKPLNIDFNGYG
jgi:hypothetical protein